MAPPLLTVRSGAVVAAFHDRALAEAWLGDNLRPFQDCSGKGSRDGSVQQSQSSGDVFDVQIPDGLCVERPGQVGKLPPGHVARGRGTASRGQSTSQARHLLMNVTRLRLRSGMSAL